MTIMGGLPGERVMASRASGSPRWQVKSSFVRYHHVAAPEQGDGKSGWRVGGAKRHQMLSALEKVESKKPEIIVAGLDEIIRGLISAKGEIDNAVRTALIRDFAELLFRFAESKDQKVAREAVEKLIGLETFAREVQGVEVGTSGTFANYIDQLLLYDLYPKGTTEDIKRYFAEMGRERESGNEGEEQIRSVAIIRLMGVAAKIVASEVQNPWLHRHILKTLRDMGANANGILLSPPAFEVYYTKEDEPGWAEAKPKIIERGAELEAIRTWRKMQAAEGLNELIAERCESLRDKLVPDMDQVIAIVGSRSEAGMQH